MKEKIARAAMGEVAIGMTMVKKILGSEAPSILDASSSSDGIDSMNWRIIKTPKVDQKPVTMIPPRLSINPISPMTRYKGTNTTANGTIMVPSNSRNSCSLPKN